MNSRYSRQILFPQIGEKGQALLSTKKVLIVGVGALGTVSSNHLARAGAGYIRIADRDYVEASNLQRQMLFDEQDAKEAKPKAVAAKEKLTAINSDITVDARVTDVNSSSIEDLVEGMDLVIDGTDNFQTRFLLNDASFKHETPFIYGGAVSSRGMSAPFLPGRTPCLRCLLGDGQSSPGETCDTVGVISPVVDMVASFQAAEAIKILTEKFSDVRTSLVQFDLWNFRFHEMGFPKPKVNCLTCQKKEYPDLYASEGDSITTLCGRETVQIQAQTTFDLTEWADKLRLAGQVKKTPFLIRVELDEGERLVIFQDGRVLVQGTEDVSRAKTLFSRYIGF
ncbi:ThiF family adenylyltransferase [Bacillus sp. FJAT-44742]|uniref:ThiF family adenylyltransferase n=1 Tax=Bacillus sp. FJAT-44742 TaxID=2014005 RepID=UPI000C235E15|nr:ThiF family adenylyltransferase [Bacillus sp. FJAT-44742]